MTRTHLLLLSAALAVLPAVTAWNLAVAERAPWRTVRIGAPLAGVTTQVDAPPSFTNIVQRRFQKAFETRVTHALPVRSFLVRLNNQLRLSLFREASAGIVVGRHGQLVTRDYVDEYCARQADTARRNADWAIPRLRDIQSAYRARGAVFLYVITPSKVAQAPEYFVPSGTCADDAQKRRQTADYAALLRAAGIAVVDTASLVHGLKAQYPFDLFPRGGVHWNALAATQAAATLVTAINAQAGTALVPAFTFHYAMAARPAPRDRDLAELANVLFPDLDYPTTTVTPVLPTPCDAQDSSRLDVAVIGGSFMHQVSEILAGQACLTKTLHYFYMRAIYSGVPQTRLRAVDDADRAALRTMRIVLLEENEGVMADRVGLGADQLQLLHDALTR